MEQIRRLLVAVLGDTAHVVVLAVAVGKSCGAAGKGVVTTVAGGNGPGPAENQLNSPRGVALDASGNLYVADASNCRVQKIAPGAATATTVVAGVPAQQWSNINSFGFLEGLAVDAQQNLYVLSSTYNWGQTFNPGPHNPALSGFYTGEMQMGAMFGGEGAGSGPRQFAGAQDVAVDSQGSVYVSDAGNMTTNTGER
jgi:NHL repeat